MGMEIRKESCWEVLFVILRWLKIFLDKTSLTVAQNSHEASV